MSLFGALMGDFDDDLGFMNNHMNHHMNAMNMQMRSMNRLMNTFMPDPFNMLAPSPFDPGFQQGALMERGQQPMPGMGGGLFGFPAMPNFNRLLNADIGAPGGASYCQSTVMTMSAGPDGRPQIYQASSSTKTGPGGVRETRKTVQDSRTGVKKMAIGHHIGERAHIIEKEQDLRSGQLEERQEFINLDEEEAEQFDREFTSRAIRHGAGPHGRGNVPAIMGARPPAAASSTLTIEPVDDDEDDDCVIEEQPRASSGRQYAALPAPPTAPHSNSSNAAATTTTATSPQRRYASQTTTTPTTTTTNNTVNDLTNNNYLGNGSSASRRAYMRNGHLATPRRPLRTPSSSPLATVPSGSLAATPSLHPHPYAGAVGRRNQRGKHHHTSNGPADDGPEPKAKAAKRGKH